MDKGNIFIWCWLIRVSGCIWMQKLTLSSALVLLCLLSYHSKINDPFISWQPTSPLALRVYVLVCSCVCVCACVRAYVSLRIRHDVHFPVALIHYQNKAVRGLSGLNFIIGMFVLMCACVSLCASVGSWGSSVIEHHCAFALVRGEYCFILHLF